MEQLELSATEFKHLTDLVFQREHDLHHEDDYFNAGGFWAHWTDYDEQERVELLAEARGAVLRPSTRSGGTNQMTRGTKL